MFHALSNGFLLGLSLILAIGAQNSFVLKQGLRREHVFALCLTCALSDAILIFVGVSGFKAASDLIGWLEPVLRYGGAAFLLVYAVRSFYAAFFKSDVLNTSDRAPVALMPALLTCLALTWLNPHVYLDTVVLLGSISTQYPDHTAAFGVGAMMSSFFFFFSLGFGARFLAPIFRKPLAWRILDVLIGLIMATIGIQLLLTTQG